MSTGVTSRGHGFKSRRRIDSAEQSDAICGLLSYSIRNGNVR